MTFFSSGKFPSRDGIKKATEIWTKDRYRGISWLNKRVGLHQQLQSNLMCFIFTQQEWIDSC